MTAPRLRPGFGRLGLRIRACLGDFLELGADGCADATGVVGAARHRRLILLTRMTSLVLCLAAVVFVGHGGKIASRIWVRK